MSASRFTLESVNPVARGNSDPSWTWIISIRGLYSSRVALYSLSLKDFRAPPRVLKIAVYSGVSTRMSRDAGAAFATGAAAGVFTAGAPGTAAGRRPAAG